MWLVWEVLVSDLDPDVVEAHRLSSLHHGYYGLCADPDTCPLARLVALVEKVVSERNETNKCGQERVCALVNELEAEYFNRDELQAAHAQEIMRQRALVETWKEERDAAVRERDDQQDAILRAEGERDIALAAQNESQEKYERQCAGQMSLLQRVQSAEKAQKEAEERLKEAHVMDCSCGVVSLRGQPVDPDCAALRTRTETKA
jgi:hypothetical protein